MVEAPVQLRPRYTQGRCGRCGAFELHRSHARGAYELVLKAVTPLVPMRCPACGNRRMRWPSASKIRELAPPGAAQEVPVSRRLRRKQRMFRKRVTFVVWVIGAGAVAAVLGYIASMG